MPGRHNSEMSEDAPWTHDEKELVMAAALAYQRRVIFWGTIKRIGITVAAIMTTLVATRTLLGDWWATFVTSMGAHK